MFVLEKNIGTVAIRYTQVYYYIIAVQKKMFFLSLDQFLDIEKEYTCSKESQKEEDEGRQHLDLGGRPQHHRLKDHLMLLSRLQSL